MTKMRQAASQAATTITPTTRGGSTSVRAELALRLRIAGTHLSHPARRSGRPHRAARSVHWNLHAVDKLGRERFLVVDIFVKQAAGHHEVVGRLPARVG